MVSLTYPRKTQPGKKGILGSDHSAGRDSVVVFGIMSGLSGKPAVPEDWLGPCALSSSLLVAAASC